MKSETLKKYLSHTTNNSFFLVGTCYGDPRVSLVNGNHTSRVVLVVDNCFNKDKTYIPCISFGSIAEKVANLCRNGNKVAITGYIFSYKTYNTGLKMWQVRIFFNIQDLFVITKAKKMELNENDIADLIQLFSPDDYTSLKPKSKKGGEYNAKSKDFT